jgi:hypothetical protein
MLPTILRLLLIGALAVGSVAAGQTQLNIISVQPIENSGIQVEPAPSIVVSFGNPRPDVNDAT